MKAVFASAPRPHGVWIPPFIIDKSLSRISHKERLFGVSNASVESSHQTEDTSALEPRFRMKMNVCNCPFLSIKLNLDAIVCKKQLNLFVSRSIGLSLKDLSDNSQRFIRWIRCCLALTFKQRFGVLEYAIIATTFLSTALWKRHDHNENKSITLKYAELNNTYST